MCYRYYIGTNIDFEERFSTVPFGLAVNPDYNISPGKVLPIITIYEGKNGVDKGQNQLHLARWGLRPKWLKSDSDSKSKLIANARSETIAEKGTFKESFQKRRCLVPASGFYEWEKQGKERIPHLIRMKEEKVFAFAGIYDYSQDEKGRPLTEYTILTTSPNTEVKKIHERMPVILKEEDEKLWLDPSLDISSDESIFHSLFTPIATKELEIFQISKEVNNPGNNGKDLIKPDKLT